MNNGTAATTNLVATLQPNANVLAPSGPQNYAAIVPGGMAGRDFTFTANGNSGDVITLTLQLQDGATNLGFATYSFTLGSNTACAGAPRISTSTVLSCSDGNTVATITLCNSGTATANNLVLTTANLGGVGGTPLLQSVGTLAPGACANVTVNFSRAPSGPTTLQVGGTYTGGWFNSNRRVTAPFCPPPCAPGAPGCGWEDGDMVTYNQDNWGTISTNASILMTNNFDAVYPNGVEIGINGAAGNSAIFTSPDAVLAYQPASGPPAPLDNDLVDPTSTSSGVFGGFVLALKFDVDFSDSGALHGSATMLHFGDLRVCRLTDTTAFNGQTVRQVLDAMNVALGGGPTAYTYDQLAALADNLTQSFESGAASLFAQQHLFNATTCPP
jgi:hypothetical protein